MRVNRTALWMLLAAASIGSARAEGATPIAPMNKGEVVAIMPDGHMARTTLTDTAKVEEIPWCMMFMMGADGSVYAVDTSAHMPMVACETIVQQ